MQSKIQVPITRSNPLLTLQPYLLRRQLFIPDVLVFLLFPEFIIHTPILGPSLHLQFPLPGTLFPEIPTCLILPCPVMSSQKLLYPRGRSFLITKKYSLCPCHTLFYIYTEVFATPWLYIVMLIPRLFAYCLSPLTRMSVPGGQGLCLTCSLLCL